MTTHDSALPITSLLPETAADPVIGAEDWDWHGSNAQLHAGRGKG